PDSCVDVEQLVFAIARILLEFDFDETVVVDGPQETFRERLDGRLLDCLDVGRGAPKFVRMLPFAASEHHTLRLAFVEERAIRVLPTSVTRDDFLDEDLLRLDETKSPAVRSIQLLGGVHAPCLLASPIEKILFDSRFDRQRQAGVEARELVDAGRI